MNILNGSLFQQPCILRKSRYGGASTENPYTFHYESMSDNLNNNILHVQHDRRKTRGF